VSRDPLGNTHDDDRLDSSRRQNSPVAGALPRSRPPADFFYGVGEPTPWISPSPSEAVTTPFSLITDAPGPASSPGGAVRPVWEERELDDRRSRQGRHRAAGRAMGDRTTGSHVRPARFGDHAATTRPDRTRDAPESPASFGYVPLMREPLASVAPSWSEADTLPGFEFSVDRYPRPWERSVSDVLSDPVSALPSTHGPVRASHAKPTNAFLLLLAVGQKNAVGDDQASFCLCGWPLALMMFVTLIAAGIVVASLLTLTADSRRPIPATI
jgi:hypothetical protein